MLKYIPRARRKIIPQTVRLKGSLKGESQRIYFFLTSFYDRRGREISFFAKIWIKPFYYLSDHRSKHKLFFIKTSLKN